MTVFASSGCDFIFGFLLEKNFPVVSSLILANTTKRDIVAGLYLTTNGALSEQELRDQGEVFETTIPANSEVELEMAINDLKQFMVGSALFSDSQILSSSSVYSSGTDFNKDNDDEVTEILTLVFSEGATEDSIDVTLESKENDN